MKYSMSHRIWLCGMLYILVIFVHSCVDEGLLSPDPDAPIINSFSPTSGPPGTEVTILGENFSGEEGMDSVYINGYGAQLLHATSTQLNIMVPDGATTGPISVIDLNSRKRAVTEDDFEVLAAEEPGVKIHRISPTAGVVGTSFQIIGENFGADIDSLTVRIGPDSTSIKELTDTSINTVVPPGAITGIVSLLKGGIIVEGPVFTVLDSIPRIDTLVPNQGNIGTIFWIFGKHFSSVKEQNHIQLNGIETDVLEAHNDSLKSIVPEGASTGLVSVDVNGRIGVGPVFTIIAEAPVISSIDPTSGKAGTIVTVNGNNFSEIISENKVTFNGAEATLTSASTTVLVAIVPEDATSGPVRVMVNGMTAMGPDFTVVPDAPQIISVEPSSGEVGDTVTVNGENFGPSVRENTVTFNGTIATIISANPTVLEVSVPAFAETGPLVVTVNGIASNAVTFTVLPSAPEIISIIPASAQVGSPVTITGNNFGLTISTNEVTFNGVAANLTSASNAEIIAVVPSGATTGPVVVVANGLVSNEFNFTVEPTPPEIISIAPSSAQVGSSVTITGNNFGETIAANEVTFNGVVANLTSASNAEIIAVVPSGATTGPVVVVANGLVSNEYNFMVEPSPPEINAINPDSGPFDTEVTISGNNFSDVISENTVRFNGMEAVITGASSTTITALVPRGAGSGPVSVTTNGLTGTGPDFTYIKTGLVDTYAGNGIAGFVDGPGTSAQFNGPSRMAMNGNGELIVADINNHSIRLIDTKGNVLTIAGDGVAGLVNGAGSQARFNNPAGVAVDASGNIYVADYGNHVIRMISTSNVVSIYAGTGQAGFADGNTQTASFNGPIDIAIDGSGNLYVADANNHAIRRIATDGTISTLAGNGTAGFANGNGSAARFYAPAGIGVHDANNIYVADLGNHAIRRITQAGDVTTVAGNGTAGDVDGTVAAARFRFPYDVDTDISGNIYIADDKNHKIRIISTDNTVGTYAGNGTEGFLDGRVDEAQFNDPTGVLVIDGEFLYVADNENHRIRIITFE
jgi:sugar lactone lactonase YvrE